MRCIWDALEKRGSYCSDRIKTSNGIMKLIIFQVSFAVWKLLRLTALEGAGTCLSTRGNCNQATGAQRQQHKSLSAPREAETSISAEHCFLGQADSREQLWQQWWVFWVCGYLVYLRSSQALLADVHKAPGPSAAQWFWLTDEIW